ncbi:MAG: LysR family transcriptional regulator [Burkholderiales bacterium]|nr:LysR family transcriptional regulator [Burkholderiales bacterium]
MVRIDQLDGLVAFRCVADARSFTTAAARLEVSPQAVSQAIKSLEARLGVRLFHRTTRSVSLSEAGERLWARAGPALTDLFEATESVQEFRNRPVGVLRLGISRPAFTSWLQSALADFHAAFPEIRLELSFDDGFVDIVAQGLDCGVRLGDAVAQDMVSVKVSASEPVAIVGSPDYLKRRGVPRKLADLAWHDCILFRLPSTGTVYRWELVDDGKAVEMEVAGPVIVNDTAAMLDCARAGLGLAYVLEGTATEPLRSGALVKVLPSAVPVLPGFHLYYPSRRQLPLKLRCFIDFMTERLRQKARTRARRAN